MLNSFPQVLTIAGSDSDGSAGAQADLHTFFANHTYGMNVLIAAVAGNSKSITDQHVFPLDFIDEQFKQLADDFEILATKTGMLATSELIENVVGNIQKYSLDNLVVDPVITTKHGAQLLEDSAVATLKEKLLPLALVATPNYFEAQILTGIEFKNEDDRKKAANAIQKIGVKNVIIKGLHKGDDAEVSDYVLLEGGEEFFLTSPYIDTKNINGTGDTLSASITSQLALGNDVKEAITRAHKFTHDAISKPISVGHEYGPLNHWNAMENN